MVIVSFAIDEKDGKSRFFKETFLLSNISINNIAFEMLFLILNNIKSNLMIKNLNGSYISLQTFCLLPSNLR